MILLFDKFSLPNVSPDLSDLLQLYIRNNTKVYQNQLVDKYDLTTEWKVPFIELKNNKSENEKMYVVIGYYDFDSVKIGSEIINISDTYKTLYNFKYCPRIESSIYLNERWKKTIELTKIEVECCNLGISKNKFNPLSHDTFSNDLFSYTMELIIDNKNVYLCSDDLVHRLSFSDIGHYSTYYNRAKKNILYSVHNNAWYDYNDARTFFELYKNIKSINYLFEEGLKVEDIDFNTYGNIYINGMIKPRFAGFINEDDFLYSILRSQAYEENDMFIFELSHELSERMIPFYNFVLEKLLESKIFYDENNKYKIQIERCKFESINQIIPYLFLNIKRIIDNSSYNRIIRVIRKDSDEEYSKLVMYQDPIFCKPFEIRANDILKIKARHEYKVFWRTGDRDDFWYKEKEILLSFSFDVDSLTTCAIKCTNMQYVKENNSFIYKFYESGSGSRISLGYDKDYSQEYRKTEILRLCNAMYHIYKTGVWN